MSRIPESLRALLTNLIDYAGLYPPAALPMDAVAQNFEAYLDGPDYWILNRVVLPAEKLATARIGERWRVSLLVDTEPGPLPAQVETLETKRAGRLSLPTYCEAPIDRITDAFGKLRTGGVTPEAIPTVESVAGYLHEAAARRLPFKATAGLHHPLRSRRALTYASDSPRSVMHGFLNVFVASVFAWHGADRESLIAMLNETDSSGFRFDDDALRWRDHRLWTAQLEAARRDFAHSFGSCSFEEPIADLREMGLLP